MPNYANPPTLAMAVTAFIERFKKAQNGPSDFELGLNTGQVAFEQAKPSGAESRYLQDSELAVDFLKEIYQPLKRHYDWFRKSQRGLIKQYGRTARSRTEAYRWRGRTADHVLTSGMDDYPRGPPHAGELHLDLLSWMGFFSKTMREIAEFIGETDDAITFTQIEKAVLNNLEGGFLYLAEFNTYVLQICIGTRMRRCTVISM